MCPFPVRIGYYLASASVGKLVQQSIKCERAGFSSVWMPDHIITTSTEDDVCPEIWTTLTAIALNTRVIRLGPAVTDFLRRHPATTAQSLATLDLLSKGRANLGLGMGIRMNCEPFEIKWPPTVAAFLEAIEVIRSLLGSSPHQQVRMKGTRGIHSDAFLQVKPFHKRRPPIYVGGLSKKTRQIAGALGDGWLPYLSTLSTYKHYVLDIKQGAQRTNRSSDEIDLCAYLPTCISRKRNKIAKAIEPIRRTLATQPFVMKDMGYEPDDFKMTDIRSTGWSDWDNEIRTLSRQIPLEAVEDVCAIGTADDCISKIEEYIKLGARHIILRTFEERDTFKKLKDSVLPYFANNV